MGFNRIHLKPNQKKTVSFTLSPKDLELIDKNKKISVEPRKFNIAIGNSSTDFQLESSFKITK